MMCFTAACARHRLSQKRGDIFQPIMGKYMQSLSEGIGDAKKKEKVFCSFCQVILPKLLLRNLFELPCLPLPNKTGLVSCT